MESTLWMLGVYNSVMGALDFITGAEPGATPDGYTAQQTRSYAHSVPNPLLELPPARTWDQGMRADRKEMLAPTAQPPPPHALPSLLGHRRRISQDAEVFNTRLPGEMPCSPMAG
ncbi:IIV3-029R [Symbiodinium sp. CCMP2456]|nr:IIV3-029R [Symbiodinium sp. CCMP2456]